MPIGTPVSLGTATSTGVQSSNALTTTAAIQANDLVAVAVHIDSSTNPPPTVSSVSDGTNTYTRAVRINNTTVNAEIWYKCGAAAVSLGATITATWSGSNTGAGTAHSIHAARVSGVAVSSALDQTASQSATTSTPSVTTGALSQPDEIAIGFAYGTSTFTESSGFSTINSASQSGDETRLSDKIVSSTSPVTDAPSWSSSAAVLLLLATFKSATVAASGSSSGTGTALGVSGSVNSVAGASAGVGTALGVGITIIPAIGFTAGSSSVNGVGAGVIGAAGVSAGLADVEGVGAGVIGSQGISNGLATVTGIRSIDQLISTNMIQKPVDYALAGEQTGFRKGRAPARALRAIFNE